MAIARIVWILDWEMARREVFSDVDNLLDNLWLMKQNPRRFVLNLQGTTLSHAA
jgi:hypothetical protein